jgi:hypothetical protein
MHPSRKLLELRVNDFATCSDRFAELDHPHLWPDTAGAIEFAARDDNYVDQAAKASLETRYERQPLNGLSGAAVPHRWPNLAQPDLSAPTPAPESGTLGRELETRCRACGAATESANKQQVRADFRVGSPALGRDSECRCPGSDSDRAVDQLTCEHLSRATGITGRVKCSMISCGGTYARVNAYRSRVTVGFTEP